MVMADDDFEVEVLPGEELGDELTDEPLEPVELPFEYDESEPNLVEQFKAHPDGEEFLKETGERVREDWTREFDGSEGYRKRFAKDWKLVAGEMEPKDWPFKNCAQAHVPIAIENISRLSLRAEGELFGNWTSVFGVMPMGPEDQPVADILTIHGNWQIRNQISDFRRQMSRGLLAFFMIGDVIARSYFDENTSLNCHEILTPDEFVTPYTYTTTRPDFSDVPWYAFQFTAYRHELEAKIETWTGVEELLEDDADIDDDPERPIADQLQEFQGKTKEEGAAGTSPYKLIHWEGFLTVPNQPKQRFCQVIIDYRSRIVLKFGIHEEPNWQDVERFRMQQAELESFRQAQGMHAAMVQQHDDNVAQATIQSETARSLAELGQTDPTTAQHAEEALQAAATAPLPPPPPPPPWLLNPDDPGAGPEPPKLEPIRMFHHAVCIEPLVGGLGLSYGRMEADFNRAADTLLSQYIDTATLSNCPMFLGASELQFDGEFEVSPGKIIKVKNIAPGDLQNALIPLKFAPANPQMVEIVDKLYGWGQTAMQSPAVLSGEPGKSGETYRGLSARIEQATKPLSTLTGKYKDFVESILKANARLNSIFLRDEEMFMISNHVTMFMEQVKISRDMYRRSYQIEIRADLRFTSLAQKVAEADEIVQMSMNVPALMQNQMFQKAAVKKALEARGRYDMVQVMAAGEAAMAAAAAQAAAMGMPPPGAPQPGQEQKPQGKSNGSPTKPPAETNAQMQ